LQAVYLAARVQKLDGVIGVVARHTRELAAVIGGEGDAAVAVSDFGIRIEQRFTQLRAQAGPSDVRQVRTGRTAAAADRVALRASGFAEEERGARGRIAGPVPSKATAVRLRR